MPLQEATLSAAWYLKNLSKQRVGRETYTVYSTLADYFNLNEKLWYILHIYIYMSTTIIMNIIYIAIAPNN